MMIHRKVTRTVSPSDVLALAGSDPRAFLIHFGELETAILDQGCTRTVADQLREVSLAAATQFRGGTGLQPVQAELPNHPITIRVPEGYSYYGVFPEQYADSATKFFQAEHPTKVVCIGIRSIGTSLSAVVHATLEGFGCQVYSRTVRPEGHPFDRHVQLPETFDTSAHFVVVDEGPGLSGSSFASVADKLNELGVPDERIAFLPHWNPSGDAFVSQRARDRWQRHDKYVSEAPGPPTSGARFAGLGFYGQEKLKMAQALADAGFGPPVLGLENGYLITAPVSGEPAPVNRELLNVIARYLAFRGARTLGDAGRCITDGCMFPQNWLATPTGFIKLDAVHHGDSPFYPGPTDIAWDLAGAVIEFQLNQPDSDYLIDAYARAAGDSSIRERLPFYLEQYRAFREERKAA